MDENQRTDADTERAQAQAGQGILEKIRPTSTEQGGSCAVVLAVVGGIEAVRGQTG